MRTKKDILLNCNNTIAAISGTETTYIVEALCDIRDILQELLTQNTKEVKQK